MTFTGFTYKSNLELIRKADLLQIADLLGVTLGKNFTKEQMTEELDEYVKVHPMAILGKLCLKELELVRELLKAGSNNYVAKAPRRTNDTIKMLLLVSVYYDKKTRKERILMADELRELFAPLIAEAIRVAKKTKKEKDAMKPVINEKSFPASPFDSLALLDGDDPEDVDVMRDEVYEAFINSLDEITDVDFERLHEFLQKDLSDMTEETSSQEEEDKDYGDEDEDFSCKYSCGIFLMEDIRKLKYKGQANVTKVFHNLARRKHLFEKFYFVERYEETYEMIDFDNLDDSLEKLAYNINDLDNAIMEIDYNDPMTFFDIARKLAKVIEKEGD